jgi:c-di-AMP phosphodiesterase-like protein
MNKLLKRERFWLAYSLLLEAVMLATLTTVYILYPSFGYYFYIAIGVGAFIALYDLDVALVFNLKIDTKKGKTETTSAEIIGNDINEAYTFGGIGLAVCDKNNVILWVNDFLGKRMPNIVDKNITQIFPSLSTLMDTTAAEDSGTRTAKIIYESHTYAVELLQEARLFVFRDTTDYDKISNTYNNIAPVIGYICIDNYNDIQMTVTDESRFNDMLATVRGYITELGRSSHSMMRKLNDDHYMFITTSEEYNKLFQDHFSIVEKVRNAYPNGFTVSLGIALGFPDGYAKLAELASNALDVALSRGGDQTVIHPFGKAMIFLGGKSELKPNQNKVKSRTLSNSLLTIIENHKQILIMGHDNADFDAIGACLGVYAIASFAKVPAHICFEDQLVEDKCRHAVESRFSPEEMSTIFVDMKNVDKYIGENTLLVFVDSSNPKRAIFQETLKKIKDIAVIDHHRPGQYVISDPSPVFNHIDSSASSASEIITSFIMYNSMDIPVSPKIATFLLAGIALDTHYFKEKATNYTFEACSQLMKYQADSGMVDEFLKESLEEYKQKIAILNGAETPFYGCLVATSPDADFISDAMIAIVANEALDISGISVSFVIGRIGEHTVKISGRSDGSVNVQMLIEKLGGGGHLTMAAATFSDTSVAEVKKKLMLVLNDYLSDAKSILTGND